ncbi:MAG: hypothetical protein PVS3B3_13680 [Ktedonobacteraceae bacterium]
MALKVFFCYAHEDELLLNKIKMQLKPLQRQGLIELWHDREINAGMEWEHEIDKHLNTAHIILFMISPDFMNSEYCNNIEVKQAIERHKRGEARVIPVILRPVYWQGDFGMLQVLPKDALPVTDHNWHDVDQACFNVAEGIRNVVNELSEKKPPVILANDSNKVVVVAARKALPEYLKHSVYICQPNRAFQHCIRLAFYTNNKIDRRVPKIVGQVEAISKDEIETRKDVTDLDRVRLQMLLKNLELARSNDWNQQLKIIFLSSPESPDTLVLPHDVVNNLTTSNGRTVAFTQGQRYISLSHLEKEPKTTSELV